MASPLLLAKPCEGEELFSYLAILNIVASVMLIKGDEKVQRLIYYTNKAFVDAETRYVTMKKIALSFIVSLQRLRSYF